MLRNKTLYAVSALSIVLFFFVVFYSCNQPAKPDNSWKAPESADKLKGPDQHLAMMVQKGKELYDVHCWQCHGETGLGDGAAGKSLGEKPANFHDRKVRKQTDGALFWKITTGRGNMPSFEKAFTEEQRWELVSYLRQIGKGVRSSKPPTPLVAGVKVEPVMKISGQAVRILHNPVTGNLWYTTFDGDVYEIKNRDSAEPVAEKILSAKDHGIPRLQGAAFHNNTLFLSGNVNGPTNTSTKGRMVSVDMDPKNNHQLTVIFNTVEYGANKTIFDHGWNALEISPDGKYIYVNSGARTDHGEVQDNGGLYPGARDNALTSKIFRFPIDSKDLLLTDDIKKLIADGYLFSQGIRNAYDMAFDPSGNLFGVSNSPDYDMSEDMFWLRQGHHYGFPWMAGGIENPQQFPGWKPENDPFVPKNSHSFEVKYFHSDSTFPKRPDSVKFSPGVQNLGPDANEYRGHSGEVLDGDITGIAVSTFTAHCCPIGLCFDTKKTFPAGFNGDGFVIRYSLGERSSMMKPFTNQGADLLHLQLTYNPAMDNYFVKTNRIVEGFNEAVDEVIVGNSLYVIEYGGSDGNIWKITLPGGDQPKTKKTAGKK